MQADEKDPEIASAMKLYVAYLRIHLKINLAFFSSETKILSVQTLPKEKTTYEKI